MTTVVPPSAGAFYGVLVVLHDRRADRRDIDDLVRRGHPRDRRQRPGPACTRTRLAGTAARCAAGSRSRPGTRPALRAAFPAVSFPPAWAAAVAAAAKSCRAGHQPREASRSSLIPRDRPFQPGQPLRQLCVRRLQLRHPLRQRGVVHREHPDHLPLQRDQPVTGSIQRHCRHKLQSSGQRTPVQHDTPAATAPDQHHRTASSTPWPER